MIATPLKLEAHLAGGEWRVVNGPLVLLVDSWSSFEHVSLSQESVVVREVPNRGAISFMILDLGIRLTSDKIRATLDTSQDISARNIIEPGLLQQLNIHPDNYSSLESYWSDVSAKLFSGDRSFIVEISLPPHHWKDHQETVAYHLKSIWAKAPFLHAQFTDYHTLLLLCASSIVFERLQQLFPELSSLLHQLGAVETAPHHEKKNRRLKLLEEKKFGPNGGNQVEFFVHDSLVGIVIGRQGENVSRISRTHKVEVRVFPDESGCRRLRIYGTAPTRLKNARAELEYLSAEIPLPPQAADFKHWLLNESATVKDIVRGIHSLWLDESNNTLIVCGLKFQIDEILDKLTSAYVSSLEANSPATQAPNTGALMTGSPMPQPSPRQYQHPPLMYLPPLAVLDQRCSATKYI